MLRGGQTKTKKERRGRRSGQRGGQRRVLGTWDDERHREAEILMRVRPVMFKLSDNILLCLQGCSLWTNNRCWAGLKNSAHCIMYKGLARKHEGCEGDSIKRLPFTIRPHSLPVCFCCYICVGLMLRQDTQGQEKRDTASDQLTLWLIVHKTPEWTSCRPTCFSASGEIKR